MFVRNRDRYLILVEKTDVDSPCWIVVQRPDAGCLSWELEFDTSPKNVCWTPCIRSEDEYLQLCWTPSVRTEDEYRQLKLNTSRKDWRWIQATYAGYFLFGLSMSIQRTDAGYLLKGQMLDTHTNDWYWILVLVLLLDIQIKYTYSYYKNYAQDWYMILMLALVRRADAG